MKRLVLAVLILSFSYMFIFSQNTKIKVVYKNAQTNEVIQGGKFVLDIPVLPPSSLTVYDATAEYEESLFSVNTDYQIYPCPPSGYYADIVDIVTGLPPIRYYDKQRIGGIVEVSGVKEIVFLCIDVRNQPDQFYRIDNQSEIYLNGGVVELSNRIYYPPYYDMKMERVYCTPPTALPIDYLRSVNYITDVEAPFGYTAGEAGYYSPGNSENIVLQNTREEISLHFYNEENPSPFVDEDIQADYEGLRVGEYVWVTKNFTHVIPRREMLWADWDYIPCMSKGHVYPTEDISEVTQNMLDRYTACLLFSPSHYQLDDITDFEKYYGRYYEYRSMHHMSGCTNVSNVSGPGYGRMLERDVLNRSWGLPTQNDFAQLFGMCEPGTDGILHVWDVKMDLGAKEGDNPLAFSFGTNPGEADGVHWFEANRNRYGFTLMPSGARLPDNESWCNGLGPNNGCWQGILGDFYHLFHAAYFHTQEADGNLKSIGLHDYIEYYPHKTYKLQSARWCRKLTDQELGYKLYINEAQTDIKKTGIYDNAPADYTELPNGYIRGFYVQYILNNPNPDKTVAEIVGLANNTNLANRGVPSELVAQRNALGIGSDANQPEDDILVYPNPTKDLINISGEFTKAVLKNSNGQILKNSRDKTIDLSPLGAGIYLLEVETLGGIISKKIMKQ